MDEQTVIDAVTLGGSVDAYDMSVWGLFLQADMIVKAVIVMLLLASFWCWAIIIGNRPMEPMAALFAAAMGEWRRSLSRGNRQDRSNRASLQQRAERVMQVTMGREMDRLERYMTFLASVGSTAPFIGLFGTVWGIMNSFQAIAMSKNTNLAVVAPGIAEALFATALGLVAAIPAVVAYNKLSSDLDRYAGRLEAFVGEFTAVLSRQLEEAN